MTYGELIASIEESILFLEAKATEQGDTDHIHAMLRYQRERLKEARYLRVACAPNPKEPLP